MKRGVFICIIIIVAAVFTLSGETIKIGYFNIAPHISLEEGASKPTGAIVDHWEEVLAPAMGVDIQWIGPLPFPEVIARMQGGEIDVMALATFNEARTAFMDYPDNELFETGAFVAFFKASIHNAMPNWNTLRGKKVVVGDTYPYVDHMRDAGIQLVQPEATMINDIGFEMLKNREVEAVATQQRISVFYYLKTSGNLFLARNIKIFPVLSEPRNAAFTTFHPSRTDLKSSYDRIINSSEDKEYSVFVDRYIR